VIDKHRGTAVVTPLDIELKVKSLEFTLDEGWAPYGQIPRLVCEMPSAEDRALLDPRENDDMRVTVRLRRDFGSAWTLADVTALGGGLLSSLTTVLAGEPLSGMTNLLTVPWNGSTIAAQIIDADLTITEREFDDGAGEVTFAVATDEALLIGDVLLAGAPLDPGSTDLVTIVNSVLARYGTMLDPSSETATVAEVDATLWKPGVSAWDYLDGLLEPASLRLWCDVDRTWRLTQRQAAVEGALNLSTSTMTQHRDRVSFDPQVWCDAVLIHYKWVDDLGVSQEDFDYDGDQPSQACLVIERDGVYPGPGAAAGVLARMQGRGRVLTVEADSRYTARPGMAATIEPPDTVTLTGYVSQVAWRLPEAEMTVLTRGLVDTPESAWIFLPVGESWDDSPVGESWEEEVV
jgi:hypothetical protein